jgi:L-iditol 2-dehydrogenase
MKAMMLTGIRAMEMRETPQPEIRGDEDVLIRMSTVGVCGSDVHYYTTGRIGSQVVQYPFTVGHEGAGVVEAVGTGVSRVKVGDRVAIEPAMPCWNCDQCKIGRPHTCRSLKFLGCPGQAEGCLSEFLVMPQESCLAIPSHMTLTQAALSEPLAIGVYAVQLAGDLNGASIGILGSGPIGLSVLAASRCKGVSNILVTDKIDDRLAYASKAGATSTANPSKEDVVGEVNAKLDVVFECCGQQEAIDQAINMLKPGGKLMMIGIPEVDRISFQIDYLRRKEIAIQNVRRQNHCTQLTLDALANDSIDIDYMATHRFELRRSKEAFDLVAGYLDGVVKAMIDFD